MKNPAARGTPPAPDDEGWIRDGLRALRERVPSEESKRATLAQLGVESAPVRVARSVLTAPPPRRTWRGILRWLAWGLLLGSVALALQRLLR